MQSTEPSRQHSSVNCKVSSTIPIHFNNKEVRAYKVKGTRKDGRVPLKLPNGRFGDQMTERRLREPNLRRNGKLFDLAMKAKPIFDNTAVF